MLRGEYVHWRGCTHFLLAFESSDIPEKPLTTCTTGQVRAAQAKHSNQAAFVPSLLCGQAGRFGDVNPHLKTSARVDMHAHESCTFAP